LCPILKKSSLQQARYQRGRGGDVGMREKGGHHRRKRLEKKKLLDTCDLSKRKKGENKICKLKDIYGEGDPR